MRLNRFFTAQKTDSKALLEWETQDFVDLKRGKIWYVVFHVILALIVFYGITTNNWIFSSLILLVAGVYMITTLEHPTSHVFKIKEDGVEFHDKMIMYSNLIGFFIDNVGKNYKMLHFVVKARPIQTFEVFCPNVDSNLIKEALSDKIPFIKNQRNSLISRLFIILKI